MHLLPTVGKARKPKFELHLKIYDLNNVPLVSGSSFVKWHLAHSMHAEHRGRTNKCPIANHKVDYSFAKHISPIRITIDKNNNLTDCPLELEVVQEFAHTEKIVLGYVKLNLSEYVEESENLIKDVASPGRGRSSSFGVSPTTVDKVLHGEVEDGVIRRYLMQDSKVNSTLKIGILMVQKDGDRNFTAPQLRTAPVFGSIAGFTAGEAVEDEAAGQASVPSISKPRDAAEVQDLYRRTLAASWYRQPSELPADECIEDIFSGGNGWRTKGDSSATPGSEDEEETDSPSSLNTGTIRPRDFKRLNLHNFSSHFHSHHGDNGHSRIHSPFRHQRTHSGSSDKSVSTVTGRSGGTGAAPHSSGHHSHHGSHHNHHSHNRRTPWLARESNGDLRDSSSVGRSRGSSLVSMTPTLGSDDSGGRGAARRAREREIAEHEARDNLVAWRLPGGLTAS
ncbi:respiratory complex assembly protein Rmp1 [Sarocladium implicatum]|nr:respiratory complex assembly protein Rmp1 [Sarocladium implicatum]